MYNQLVSFAGLTTLVGSKIYPVKLPQSLDFTDPSLQAVTYAKISNPRRHLGTRRPRFQISCWAKRYGEVKQVAEQVQAAVEAMDETGSVFAVFPENEVDMYNSETGLYHVPVDVIIYFEE